jgi:hypothetical protein
MKVKFKSSLILLLGWLFLSLGAGIFTALVAMKLAKQSLAKVDETEIMKRQSSATPVDGNKPRIIPESQILKKVNIYRERQEKQQLSDEQK